MKKAEIPKPNRPVRFAKIPVEMVKKIIKRATLRAVKAKRFQKSPG